jgi:hypothetical protein
MQHNSPRKETSLTSVPDDAILAGLVALVQKSRRVDSELVAHLAEADARRLHAREGFPSMFAYCTESLHLSEAEAYLRISVARASREHPALLAMLADGRLHLSGIARLAPQLTAANRDDLLQRATHKSKREILELIADLAPQPDAPTVVRKLPEQRVQGSPASQLRPDADATSGASLPAGARAKPSFAIGPKAAGRISGVVGPSELCPNRVERSSSSASSSSASSVDPLGSARYKVQFTASARLREKLDRLRALMRPEIPDGDLATIIERAVTDKIEQIERRRHAKTERPRDVSPQAGASASCRHIPAAVRRAVHERDGNRCGFVSASGRRCGEKGALEYHHRRPFGMGGSHDAGNLTLLCRTHNAWLAEHDYGRAAMQRARERRRGSTY